ncbi:hypothetical protein HO133_006096 [Letharia lupina]|uniref:Uncharacterized protein n=1 Tax=Letharia lupina TaxID=560253 RepID=A0A8H6F7H9_9LECA|nr:uncharacterized protein HO133_006096 [Letharia lupina]KAF6218137.1 hypothetical protein HO133_006096 [Letharia lupina]
MGPKSAVVRAAKEAYEVARDSDQVIESLKMEMESLHSRTPDHTETAEPGSSRESLAYKDAQVWKDLKTETGFASCTDYMEFYKKVRPDFEDRLQQFRELPGHALSLRRDCYSGTALIQALREPPGNVCTQLVLWSLNAGGLKTLDQEMAEALILGLKLDPQLLADYDRLAREDHHPRSKGLLTSQIKSVVTNYTVTTLSQKFMPEVANAVPVLLVAFRHYGYGRLYGGLSAEDILAKSDQGKPPFHISSVEESRGTEDDNETKIGQLYARSVETFMAQGRLATPSLLLAATSPLLSIEAYRVQDASDDLQGTYDKLAKHRIWRWDISDTYHRHLDKNLDIQRLNLRRILEEGETHVSQILRYLLSEVDFDWSEEPSYVSIKADWRSLIDEARRLEAEVRDYMQLQVGNLSLEESRRSIELSNIQIRESQSVTILAFVYVPLNLATSIFGMNIQQLNHNGQNLWVFFVTAVVALLVTGGSWVCSKKAMAWYKERAAVSRAYAKKEGKQEYGLLLRMAMLVWLVRNGHTAWMWKSGAWLAILMNSKTPGETTYARNLVKPACIYVSEYSR